ncbi:MAG: IMP cyclohydrolase [Deltaproteobacteria bacterium]|nr:MAG: IMP cyclohydrolase [Deltaproteobacteria bacterium]
MSDLKTMYTTIQSDPFPPTMTLTLGETTLTFHKRTWTINGQEQGLRYGENPDQPAALYELQQGGLELGGITLREGGQGLVSAMTEEQMIQAGKHPGKINLTDVDNGINILQYLTAQPAAVILKHNNPCGAAWSDEGIGTALSRAFLADRIAAFGGAIVINRPLTSQAADIIAKAYFEVVAAPSFEAGTIETLASRKNLRILEIPGLAHLETLTGTPFLDLKSLTDGGIIAQLSFRNAILTAQDFLPAQATTKDGSAFIARGPSKQEADDLLFAWAVEAGVTSNSVIMARNGVTTAIGTGEQDRVGCVELAIHKAYTKYADNLAFEEQGCSLYELKDKAQNNQADQAILEDILARTDKAKGGLPGSVMVSDGFFPFRDGVDVALAQGITAIAQPGGSIRDYEVIQAVNEAVPQAAMVFTGQRSFKH